MNLSKKSEICEMPSLLFRFLVSHFVSMSVLIFVFVRDLDPEPVDERESASKMHPQHQDSLLL